MLTFILALVLVLEAILIDLFTGVQVWHESIVVGLFMFLLGCAFMAELHKL